MNAPTFAQFGKKIQSTGKYFMFAVRRKSGGKLSIVLIGAIFLSLGIGSPSLKAVDKSAVSLAIPSFNSNTNPKQETRIPSSGLIAYYPFNGNANDASAFRNNGVVHGATLTTDRCGRQNSAYSFTRSNANWIEIPHNDIQNSPANSGLTLSLWIKVQDVTIGTALIGKQPSGWPATFDRPTTSNHGGLFDLDTNGPHNGVITLSSQFHSGDGTEGHELNVDHPLVPLIWQHIVVTVDLSNPSQELAKTYINGVLVGSSYYDVYAQQILSQPTTEPIRIGKRKDSHYGTGHPAYFDGEMDEIRIYNRPLSGAEVAEIYHAEGQCVIKAFPLVSLGDVNQDNSPEIAVVAYNATLQKSTATVKNAQTGGLVKKIPLNGQFVPTKANVLPDLNGNGAPEIAVLGVRSSDQAVQVEVRDSLSGVKLSAVPFDSTFTPLDLGVVRDISGKGTAGLVVLQQSDTDLRVQLKNALSGVEIGNINFSAGYKGIDLLVLGFDFHRPGLRCGAGH